MEELQWIEARICVIEQADCDKSFSGFFVESGDVDDRPYGAIR
jgi:hypothetical protein